MIETIKSNPELSVIAIICVIATVSILSDLIKTIDYQKRKKEFYKNIEKDE